jgi:hypothetical protein
MADYATLLRGHVSLTCRCVDRFFLQGYVPKLQTVGLICKFLRWQRKVPIPSWAAFGKIGEAYVRDIERYARDNAIPLQHFKKGESKEAVARHLIDGLQGCRRHSQLPLEVSTGRLAAARRESNNPRENWQPVTGRGPLRPVRRRAPGARPRPTR